MKSEWRHFRGLTPNFFLVLSLVVGSAEARQAQCAGWQQCRQLALEAAERRDYEAFHDLAWRAVQQGPAGDPQLMYLLARAQSLSGRPHDALVMLRRLAEKGAVVDAATNDDFRRVRALADWPAVEKRLATAPAPPAATVEAAARPLPTPPALRIGKGLTPGGLAYDSASARFVVGDRTARKLVVLSERTTQPQDLVRAESAGFSNVAALAIDHRRGDLWVVSTDDAASALHRLQLISGRPLETYPMNGATFADVALMQDGTPLVLDSAGSRLFRLRRGALDELVAFDRRTPTSAAPAGDRTIYVAHRDGLANVDPTTRRATAVKAGGDVELTGLTWVRAYRGGLVALQAHAQGCRLIVLEMNGAGTQVRGRRILDDRASCAAAAVSGDDVYYFAEGADATIIRRVPLR